MVGKSDVVYYNAPICESPNGMSMWEALMWLVLEGFKPPQYLIEEYNLQNYVASKEKEKEK